MEPHCVGILSLQDERIHHASTSWNDHEMMKQVGWV